MLRRTLRWMVLPIALLLMSVAPSAQEVEVIDLVRNYISYNRVEKEFIYTHLNKVNFFPGETVWFKSYVLNAASGQPFLGTRNLYAELLDGKGRAVHKKILFVNRGTSFGEFALPDTIPSGTYLLRTYTSWSRNFGDHYSSLQPIRVIGPAPASASLSERKYDIQVFPEGGNFLAGVEQIVGFKVVDESGRGVALSGNVFRNGKLQRTISVNELGMGSTSLKAELGDALTASFSLPDGRQQAVSLPSPSKSVVGLSVSRRPGSVMVSIRVHPDTLPSIADQNFYIMIHRRGAISHLLKSNFGNRPYNHFLVPDSVLPEGVAHVTVFNAHSLPVADRALFRFPAARRADLQLNTRLIGDSLEVEVATSDSGRAVPSNLSLSFLPEGTVSDMEERSILARYLLEADLEGYIERPQFYFGQEGGALALDDLLLTQGWKSYDWKAIASGKKPATPFPFEQGFTIEGEVPGFASLKDKGSRMLALISPGNSLQMPVQLDEQGVFRIPELFIRDSSTLFLNYLDPKDKRRYRQVRFRLVAPQFDTAQSHFAPLFPSDRRQDALGLRSGSDSSLMMEEVKVTTRISRREVFAQNRFVSAMDKVVAIDKSMLKRYRKLYDLLRQEFMMQIGEDSNMNVVVDFQRGPISFKLSSQPTLVVDGITMHNLNMLAQIDITQVAAIAVNKSGNSGLGARGAGGSIVIQTRNTLDDINEEVPTENLVAQKLLANAYALPAAYYTPRYNVPVTDYRFQRYAELFWVPELITDENGKASFRITLPEGVRAFRLQVEGITDKGKLLFFSGNIRHKNREW